MANQCAVSRAPESRQISARSAWADQLEKLSLHPTDLRVHIVECSKQRVCRDVEHQYDANTHH
jgi:hypothetical protein